MKKIIIIGAGIGGLATANLLAKRGYEVTIYEKNESPGGRAGTLVSDGFVFDTGPSWYLMPEVFETYFKLLGENIEDYLTLRRLDPAYKVFFSGSSQPVTITSDFKKDKQTFEDIEAGAGEKLETYLTTSQSIYRTALRYFLYTNFNSVRSFLRRDVIMAAPQMIRGAYEPIHRYVSRYFKDQRLKQIMEYPMVFLGTSPFQAPSLYSLMSFMDFKQGVFYPEKGLYTIIDALVRIGQSHGVTIHCSTDVSSIVVENGVARGVMLSDGSFVPADRVISNADLHFTETSLLTKADQTFPASYWKNKQASPSAILMYLGVKGKLPNFTHHNLLFVDSWSDNFTSIFKDKKWPTPASIYICNPSKTDDSVAPEGHENLFVLVPGPAQLSESTADIERLADLYLDQIANMTDTKDLRERIVFKKVVGPGDFASQFNSWNGTALGMSHVLSQSAFFRPRNKSKKVDNLYYVGANTVPGIGLPMCLISAQLVTERVEGDEAKAAV